jgi:hypothetical protein
MTSIASERALAAETSLVAGLADLATDLIEQRLLGLERVVAEARREQARLLVEIDRRQVRMEDGCRTLDEWIAGRLDVSPETSASLQLLARSEILGDGELDSLSYDKLVAVTKLSEVAGKSFATSVAESLDVTGIRRLTSRHRLISTVDERAAFDGRYLVIQPNLDESSWRTWGRLGGVDGGLVERALRGRADRFPARPDGTRANAGQRLADALTAICQDAMCDSTRSDEPGPSIVVFVDRDSLVTDNAASGVEVESGPPVGRMALEELLCTGSVTRIAVDGDEPKAIGRASRAIPPAVRRFVAHRDGGACTADGCASRYRLQPHHIVPWSEGGNHRADNLTTLCWYHHHVVIHGMGYRIDPETPPQRRRFLQPTNGPP